MSRPVNPYVAGAPLREERGFFGRQDTLEWVTRELRNPATNALVLFGQRRIGKTTLLLQLQCNLPDDAFLPVYFDLQDQATRPLGQVLADLADTVAEQADLESPSPRVFDDQGRFFRRTFLQGLYSVALRKSRRLVFLLDEFDVLDQAAEAELPETAAAKALFPFLRRVMTEDPLPAFVFIVGRRAEDLSLDFTSTFKASLVREIWVLDRESAEALVRQAETNDTLRFTDQAVARVLSLTSGHPYLTQLLCQRVWERAYIGNPTTPPCIDLPEVEGTVPDALKTGDQALAWLWNGLGPAEKIYASALAEAADEGQTISEDWVIQVLTAHAARLRTREVELAPRDLVNRRVLEVIGEREYRFAVELFCRWVRQNKPLQDVKDELDRVDPLAERLFGIGQGFFRRRQWEAATRYFRDALGTNLRHFRARLHLGEALLELGQTDKAVVELERAYELDRDEARLPLARALVAEAKAREGTGDEDGALAAYERALQISPNEQVVQERWIATWARRGDVALEGDDLEAALAAYRKVGNAEKVAHVEELQRQRLLEQLEEKVRVHEQAEEWDPAIALYEQGLQVSPENKKWRDALTRAKEQRELTQIYKEALTALGAGKRSKAVGLLIQIITRQPSFKETPRYLLKAIENIDVRLLQTQLEEELKRTEELQGQVQALSEQARWGEDIQPLLVEMVQCIEGLESKSIWAAILEAIWLTRSKDSVLSKLKRVSKALLIILGGVEEGIPSVPSLAPTGPHLGHFVTTYYLGHDTYDESFSIETPMGEFLGECGVGISETIEAGGPTQVTAFEVWLFDKSDIRTITKVLMSQYAYNDEALRAKLASKGDPVLAELGKDMVLETSSIKVDARVSDVKYGSRAMPPQSYFTKLTVELVARMTKIE
jgi:tetratricopeptide (TPR) repeat protein